MSKSLKVQGDISEEEKQKFEKWFDDLEGKSPDEIINNFFNSESTVFSDPDAFYFFGIKIDWKFWISLIGIAIVAFLTYFFVF